MPGDTALDPRMNTEPMPPGSRPRGERGQIVVIFAGAMIVLLAMCAVVVDVAWYWTVNMRMQRAADAAALAGVVWLPANPSRAYSTARAEATRNGYANGVDGVVVTPEQDPTNPRRLKIRLEGNVGTFFSRVVGIDQWPAVRFAKADYVLPVPMGSPDNYYGIGYFVKPETTTTTTGAIGHSACDDGNSSVTDPDDPWSATCTGNTPNATAAPSNGSWGTTSGTIQAAAASNNNVHARTATDGAAQSWSTFGLLSGIPSPGANQALSIIGLEVRLTDAFADVAACSSARIAVDLSWNQGQAGTWTTALFVPASGGLGSSTSTGDYTLGSPTSTAAWGSHNWIRSDFGDTPLRVRLRADKPGCSTTRINVDRLEVRVAYRLDTSTTTTTLVQNAPVPPPAGQAAITRPQRFWGAMQSKGAPSIQGDIYMTYYDARTSSTNQFYDPDAYYHYAVEIPSGGGGSVWVFDAGFCDASSSVGTGEYYTLGGVNGSSTINPVSSYFELRNLGADLLNPADDTFVASAGTDYQGMDYQDKPARTAAGLSTDTGTADCAAVSWHYGWRLLASGLGAGTYAIHTDSNSSGDPDNQNQQTALNAFAFYAASTSGSPRIYGLGAMEAYVRLPGGQASEFYFAQIDQVHAGKTMEVNLWDPGDTGALSADLEILYPTGNSMQPYLPATFTYRGERVSNSSGASSTCNGQAGTATHVVTNTGGTSLFNGCWLRIEIELDPNYSAPIDPVSGEPGWWKIRYRMGGSTTSFSTDLTTWQVNMRGNPVHLVLP